MPARLRTVLTGDTGLGKGHAPWPGCCLLGPGLRKRGGHTVASAWGGAEATAPFPASPARCGTGTRRHASSRLSCSSQSSGRKTGTGRSPRGQRCPGERGLARQRLLAAAACGARWRRCGLHGVLPNENAAFPGPSLLPTRLHARRTAGAVPRRFPAQHACATRARAPTDAFAFSAICYARESCQRIPVLLALKSTRAICHLRVARRTALTSSSRGDALTGGSRSKRQLFALIPSFRVL